MVPQDSKALPGNVGFLVKLLIMDTRQVYPLKPLRFPLRRY